MLETIKSLRSLYQPRNPCITNGVLEETRIMPRNAGGRSGKNSPTNCDSWPLGGSVTTLFRPVGEPSSVRSSRYTAAALCDGLANAIDVCSDPTEFSVPADST